MGEKIDKTHQKIIYWAKKLFNYSILVYGLIIGVTMHLDYTANPEAYSFNGFTSIDYLATENTGVMLRAECRPYMTFYEFIANKLIGGAKIFLFVYLLILLVEHLPRLAKKFDRLEE